MFKQLLSIIGLLALLSFQVTFAQSADKESTKDMELRGDMFVFKPSKYIIEFNSGTFDSPNEAVAMIYLLGSDENVLGELYFYGNDSVMLGENLNKKEDKGKVARMTFHYDQFDTIRQMLERRTKFELIYDPANLKATLKSLPSSSNTGYRGPRNSLNSRSSMKTPRSPMSPSQMKRE